MSNKTSDECAFLIQQLDEKEKNIIFYISSALPPLIRISNVFKLKQINELTSSLMKNVKSKLIDLISFLIKADKKVFDPLKFEG